MSSTRARLGRASRTATLSDETVGILGSGAFATALATVLASRGTSAVLYTEDDDVRRDINSNRRNESRLPGVSLAKRVAATNDLADLCSVCSLLVLSVPSVRVVPTLQALAGAVSDDHIIAHAVGGLGPGDKRVSQLIAEHTPVRNIAALAGPALPHELTARRSCAMVVASDDDSVSETVRLTLAAPPTLRIYRSRDLLGVELSAALVGALSVALGVSDGLGITGATRTVLLTRGVKEASAIVAADGGGDSTFYGMSGLGNLLARTSAPEQARSRDHQLGHALGRGETPTTRETEGGRTMSALVRVATLLNLEVPVLSTMDRVVRGEITADRAADVLANRDTDFE